MATEQKQSQAILEMMENATGTRKEILQAILGDNRLCFQLNDMKPAPIQDENTVRLEVKNSIGYPESDSLNQFYAKSGFKIYWYVKLGFIRHFTEERHFLELVIFKQ